MPSSDRRNFILFIEVSEFLGRTSKKIQGMLYEEQMQNVKITVPAHEAIEKSISEEYEKLVKVKEKIDLLNTELSGQLNKIVI